MSRSRYFQRFLLIGLLACSACVFDPEDGPVPREAFIKYYGEPGTNRVVDMIVNSDGNVIMLGSQKRSLDGATQDIVIIEADTIGNQINELIIDVGAAIPTDTIYNTDEYPASIKEIDNGYLVVSSFAEVIDGSPQQSNVYWAQLNDQLEIVESDTANAGDANVVAFDIMQTLDGNIVVVGMTDRPEENDLTINAGNQYFLMKTYLPNVDSTMWRKSYGYPNSDDFALNVSELDNGNIGLVGSTEQLGNGGATGNNVGIMILNELATSLVADEIYGISVDGDLSSDDFPFDAIKVGDAFLVVGTSTRGETQRPFLLGLRESGAFISSRALESRWGINATGRGVTITSTNDLIVTGSYPDFLVLDEAHPGLADDKNGEVLFMRTGQTGVERDEYENNFGLVSGNDIGEVVVTLPNGSIAIGATVDFGSNQTMMSYMKLNDQGSLLKQ